MPSSDTPIRSGHASEENEPWRGRSEGDLPQSLDGNEKKTKLRRDESPKFRHSDITRKEVSLEDLRDQLVHAFDHLQWEVENRLADCRPFGAHFEAWMKSHYDLKGIFDAYQWKAKVRAREALARRIIGSRVTRGDASEREKSLMDENLRLHTKVIELYSSVKKLRSRFSHIDSDIEASEESEAGSEEDNEKGPGLDNGANATKTLTNDINLSARRKDRVKRWRAIKGRRGENLVISDDVRGDEMLKNKSKSKNVIEFFRNWDPDDKYAASVIKIWSRPLIDLLESTIDYYPGNELEYLADGSLKMQEPFLVLFAFRRKIEDAIAKADGQAAAHGHMLMNLVMNEEMQSAALKHAEIEERLCKEINSREIWLLYTPGTIVYSKYQGHWRAYRVEQLLGDNVQTSKRSGENDKRSGVYFVNCSFASFNEKGTELRRCANSFTLLPFAGSDIIRNLKYVPAKFMEDEEEIRAKLIKRGRTYWSYAGKSHHKEYTGDAWPSFEEQQSMRVIVDYSTTSKSNRVHLDGRRINGNDDSSSDDSDRSYAKQVKPISGDYGDNLEEAFLFCPSHVDAYSLKEKDWREVALDDLQTVQFNETAFNKLVVDKAYKQVVQAMATSHLQKIATTQDLVPGKGKSLVILLHGSPGTGKTLTAECVAEYARRPLYMVTSGDLGTSATDLELKLKTTFEYAANWNAVLLLDEADVFLQERDVTYLDRNALVSVFLRELEYFQGVIFLTTNRPGALDEAFQSRIHITLWLPDLNQTSRFKIWLLFVKKLPISMQQKQQLLADIDASVGKVALNGRQIRNSMQAARALAQQKGEEIGIKHIEYVVDIGQKFTTYMKKVNRMDLEQKAIALGMRLNQATAEKD